LTLIVTAINSAPVISGLSAKYIMENELTTFDSSVCTDVDATDVLTISVLIDGIAASTYGWYGDDGSTFSF